MEDIIVHYDIVYFQLMTITVSPVPYGTQQCDLAFLQQGEV